MGIGEGSERGGEGRGGEGRGVRGAGVMGSERGGRGGRWR